ncbi:MAG: OsmC family protein [Bacteroidales bacterium]|nr:OsmC family protein [Bacteroidales bacterium]
MNQEVSLTWLEAMSFETEINGHKLIIDADETVGGQDKGPRPKPLMLAALAGCTGIDVISILKKMRVNPDYFNVRVVGELTESHPKTYSSMHVIYEFKGENLPMEKLEKAVKLSEEQYCGVSALYKKAITITSEIVVL